ncbi:LacI family DNA-binding transcriptional regulator [Clostridium sp. AM58-1XD]|uniref:LacI family DNA-binding transcriptional regulator n=1 Tax=Clostridium sp. AM58-1XD TaxID=2292307 RepID=UPI000E555C74|nr:LacI family DNA-binding transcriptional regulator [Clostridium sp. AM58-1XD]RGY98862.1 LacI family transcriptional regulator [Clostridium sp. AM58-1XD]
MKNEQALRPMTIKDVAKKANVSITTVSRVLNNNDYFVSEQTKQHVLGVIEELKYRPNVLARGLHSFSTMTVGLIIQDITNPYYPRIVKGAESRAQKSKYSIILANTQRSQEKITQSLRIMWEKRVDGLIMVGRSIIRNVENSAYFHESGMKVVAVGTPEDESIHSVQIDNVEAARQACKALISLGHKRIAMIAGTETSISALERERGYRKAMEEAGFPVPDQYFVHGDFTAEGGRRAADELNKQGFGGRDGITAVFCQNDLMAIGVLNGLKANGIRVPEEVSVMGFDNIQAATFVTPALTTVAVPVAELGEKAMETLESLLKNEAAPLVQYLPTHIEYRESVGRYTDHGT